MQGRLEAVPIEQCVALKRNPQHLTPHTLDALKRSIQRDGFLAPVLLRPMGEDYEVVSGNHRVMAAREVGLGAVPAVIIDLDDREAQRIAVNLNTVHGDPSAELLAPFLAEMDDDLLNTVHLPADMLDELAEFDADLLDRLSKDEAPSDWDHDSSHSPLANCVCPTCGRKHMSTLGDDTVDEDELRAALEAEIAEGKTIRQAVQVVTGRMRISNRRAQAVAETLVEVEPT